MMSLKNGNIDWAAEGASKWDYQFKRVKLTFSKKGLKLVAELEEHNKHLRMLLDSIEKLGSSRQTRQHSVSASVFQCIRQHANNLHVAIKKGLICRCEPFHRGYLRLESRKTGSWTSIFKMLFEFHSAQYQVSTIDTYTTESKRATISPPGFHDLIYYG